VATQTTSIQKNKAKTSLDIRRRSQ